MSPQGLVLGTVQIGVPYGIANRSGMPGEEQAAAFINSAMKSGITSIDTARAYGESEARIGKALKDTAYSGEVITKLSPLSDLTDDSTPAEIESAVRTDARTSRSLLGMEVLDCLLLHRAEHLTAWDGKVWSVLQALVREGQVRRIGASVQSVTETKQAFETKGLSHIQLPLNLLDYRWREADIASVARARPDVTIHARSLYLQGLLVAGNADIFPNIEGVDGSALVEVLRDCASDLGRTSLADLCVAWARSLDWVDGLVIGMETQDQLRDNLKLFTTAPLTGDERNELEARLPRVPEQLLNPALWPQV